MNIFWEILDNFLDLSQAQGRLVNAMQIISHDHCKCHWKYMLSNNATYFETYPQIDFDFSLEWKGQRQNGETVPPMWNMDVGKSIIYCIQISCMQFHKK